MAEQSDSAALPIISKTVASPTTPPTSPPLSPQMSDRHLSPSSNTSLSPRPAGPHRSPSAMSSVYGNSKISLPGDLGSRDPRRPKSPEPTAALPGDLGTRDPRRPRSAASSPTPSGHTRSISLEGAVRIHEDPEPEEESRHESDEDADADNDNDTDADERQRGRGRKRPEPGKTTSGKAINVRTDSEDSEREEPTERDGGGGGGGSSGGSFKPDPTKGQSKLSFEKDHSAKIAAARMARRQRLVHPSTAFDAAPPSGYSTPLHGSDDETQQELLAAQKLSLTMSAVHSTPSAHRVIRQIIRGDFAHFQREAEEGRKRQRMYLVATDMSPEAEYALEWTIGTVLRDGDTLFAVYAADEEAVGTLSGEGGGVEIGHGAESVRDTAAIVNSLPQSAAPPASPGPSPLARAGATAEPPPRSPSRGVFSSAEEERRRALAGVTDRCVRLLRKTRLQVRVVVEVFHCKSPRHMITEVIDFLSPTLVIIGSRGRSAVKGVLLGSFSNYLVTKSSVPVMVARKKLRKHSKTAAKRYKDGLDVPYQGSGRSGRFSNIIEVPRTTGLRVKGWDEVGID